VHEHFLGQPRAQTVSIRSAAADRMLAGDRDYATPAPIGTR
jgi:hypothetical protein